MNKTIPKKIQRLLDRRTRLAWVLMEVCREIDKYCQSIGVVDENTAAIGGHAMIYCEPDVAHIATEREILKALNE